MRTESHFDRWFGDVDARKRLIVLAFGAGLIRILCTWMLGNGAPFGPDGTGLEAATELGGHLYPGHVWLISIIGSARTVSVLFGTLSVVLLWSYGRALRLGEGGAWLMATLPMAVYPSVISAGDAPALFFVILGATIGVHCPTDGRSAWWQLTGSLIAVSSVIIKPIALPALVLLLPRPRAALGCLLFLPLFRNWMKPLFEPKLDSGLLGSWWRGSEGQPPTDWLIWLSNGVESLAGQPIWSCSWVVFLAGIASLIGQPRDFIWDHWTRWTGMAILGSALAVACLFGDKLQARYLAPVMVASLPWLGTVLPTWSGLLFTWPTIALMTQLSATRMELDPRANPPDLPTISPPSINTLVLFEDASTPFATQLREDGLRLAIEMEPGDEFTIERQPHGREGELLWPLQTARPEVQIESDPERPITHLRVRIPE